MSTIEQPPGDGGGKGDASPATPPGPAATGRNNGYGVAAMVLGIAAIITTLTGFAFFAIPLALSAGVLATIFGVLGRQRVQRGDADNSGQALTGLILGPIAVLLTIAAVAGFLTLGVDRGRGDRFGPWDRWDRNEGQQQEYRECLAEADTVEAVDACQSQFSGFGGRGPFGRH
ncbi:MAG: hypothetical protein GEU81_00730 [Nitriliruptorales bacterium]|nr:hypothetical protein [Nitriliruptorales bacterium]